MQGAESANTRAMMQALLLDLPDDMLPASAAARAEGYLQRSPWQLQVEAAGHQSLRSGAAAAQASCREWGRRLKDAADEKRMESWLPAANGDGDREAALLQV